jgi:hypothetical protein
LKIEKWMIFSENLHFAFCNFHFSIPLGAGLSPSFQNAKLIRWPKGWEKSFWKFSFLKSPGHSSRAFLFSRLRQREQVGGRRQPFPAIEVN